MNEGATSARPPASPPPTGSGPTTSGSRPRNGAIGWIVAAVVVLALAVAGGLFSAWIVANMRAVPPPVAAAPTPGQTISSAAPAGSAGASVAPTDAPRRTPTPAPTAEITPEPFVYVVEPGDHLVNIADLYGVSVQDIMDLNGITNPNRLSVGQQLLIPGYGVQPTPKPTKPPKK